MIERSIVIGLITSTEYLQKVRDIFEIKFLQSEMARRLAGWCISYYDQYHQAPGRHIQDIFFEKLQEGLPEDIAQEIEEDILPGLSEEYTSSTINIRYLLHQTKWHFTYRQIEEHQEIIESLIEEGKIKEAERRIQNFKPLKTVSSSTIDLGSKKALEKVREAFTEKKEPLIYYPRQLGEFWNNQLIRGGFVVFMAREKLGKTWRLIEMAMRAVRQGKKVAFFQAGDMTEYEQLRRFGIYLTRKSNIAEYCGKMIQPVRDCILNQLDRCTKNERECDFGIFDDQSEDFIKNEVTLEQIKELREEFPDYKPCYNCKEYWKNKWGATWIEQVDIGEEPIQVDEVIKAYKKFFIEKSRSFKLETRANGELTLTEMNAVLDRWEKEEGFTPDVILLDYADLVVYDGPRSDGFRHQVDYIWRGLRGISQSWNALLISATQADADSYERKRLRLRNFSEAKSKYAHVTAMYGLNQDPAGREKELGHMIINKLAIREGDFHVTDEVVILQNLKRGQPFLGSYF